MTPRKIAMVGEAAWASVDPITATFPKGSVYRFEIDAWTTTATMYFRDRQG